MATNTKPTAKAEATPKKPRRRKVTLNEAWEAVADKRQALYEFGGLVVEFDHLLNQRGNKDEKSLNKALRANASARKRLRTKIVKLNTLLAHFEAQQG